MAHFSAIGVFAWTSTWRSITLIISLGQTSVTVQFDLDRDLPARPRDVLTRSRSVGPTDWGTVGFPWINHGQFKGVTERISEGYFDRLGITASRARASASTTGTPSAAKRARQ